MLQVIVIQTRWNTKRLTKELCKQKSRGSSCEPALSVHDNVNNHQDNTLDHLSDQLVWTYIYIYHMNITVSCHGVKGPMTTGCYCTIFPFCGGGKKKRPKNKGILWLGYHRYPSNYKRYERSVSVKWVFLQFSTWSPNNSLPFYGKLIRQSKVTLCPKKVSFKCFEIFPLSELVSTYDKLYIHAKKISWCRHFKLKVVRMSNNN